MLGLLSKYFQFIENLKTSAPMIYQNGYLIPAIKHLFYIGILQHVIQSHILLKNRGQKLKYMHMVSQKLKIDTNIKKEKCSKKVLSLPLLRLPTYDSLVK